MCLPLFQNRELQQSQEEFWSSSFDEYNTERTKQNTRITAVLKASNNINMKNQA